jgi:prepilin-type N-terminal cleavage/methylation domain-containing protein
MRRRCAFTLIELLVVIGLIAVLAGGLGLALSDQGSRASALQSGQYTINSLLSGARAQAALKQTNARIFVNSTISSEGFLREFYIATYNGSNWVVTGDPVLIPRGIYLVPLGPNGTKFPSTEVDLAPEAGGAWPVNYSSNAIADSSADTTLQLVAGTNLAGAVYREVQTINSRGTLSNTGTIGQRIVLSGGEVLNGTQIKFTKPEFVRGLRISNYGVASLINEATGFD